MKPEEFEVYVIPPNFMEGGTLFGGLLKTRNTIEAVILGLAVGVPVLHLPFSLTVRVVILCLTALPLVLLALIGVSGMSLSAFIRLFFCFLHNRRILSRDGTQGGKNGKTLLPSWAQQKKSDCEAEDPPLPKSRSRFSVDLKQRSVTQFKTFLQEEEAVQPLNALADYIPIEKIEHGVIYTRDHRYVKVVEVVPVNFLLRSAREQRSIIYSFISYLKIAPVKVQFKALTKRADINRHLDTVRRELEHEQDPRCRVLQEDYLKLIRQLGSREAITRRFFLVFEYEPLPGTKRGHEEEDAIASLQTAARTAANYLRQCGNEVISPENEDDATAEILYNILCRRASSEPFYQRVKSVLADYMAAGRDINTIPVNEFYAPDSIDLTALRRDGLLRTFSKDGLRGLRLTSSAKRLLLADAPEWFSAYLTGSSEPNKLKSEIPRRLRLHRMAEILTIMHNADIPAFPWEKAPFSAASQSAAIPAYYTSREVKEIGPQGAKIKSSRATGILLTDGGIFLTYNTAKAQMKWEYKAELRFKALLQTEGVMPDAEISGIVFGSTMEQLSILTQPDAHSYFLLDGSFPHFYYLTNDRYGEAILRLLCDTQQRRTLDAILADGLHEGIPNWRVENDAIDSEGNPVLFA